ncbi:MAG: ATP-binding cassette domain-containing protein [Cryomorphaceae bacterium]|nr:MAG: ATP-binding cassette domain-containing protein [Cryomorphaceae bacterium]
MLTMLKVEHIVKQYANHRALNDVSFEVPQGCVFGLLGPNGAGKTTLIRIINQITGPDEGKVFLNGEPLAPHHVHNIGYLPEERGLYKKMKVGEQALYLARLKGMTKNEALHRLKYWFDKFNIGDWWHKKVEELSKGMAQKVQFITTVMHEPRLLILDEPFSGFDPINANLIKAEILELKEKGTTIILSTHNMGSVEEICDHIALINKSRKVLSGPVGEVRNRYKENMFEVLLRGNMIGFANALWTDFEMVENQPDGDAVRCKIRLLNNRTLNDLLGVAIQHTEVIEVRELIPSMNDIFIKVVNENAEEHE